MPGMMTHAFSINTQGVRQADICEFDISLV